MNSFINIANTDTSKSNLPAVTWNVGGSEDGAEAVTEGNPTVTTGLFHELIQKAFAESELSEKKVIHEVTDELSGNDFPITDTFSALSAENVLSSQQINISATEISITVTENKTLASSINEPIVLDKSKLSLSDAAINNGSENELGQLVLPVPSIATLTESLVQSSTESSVERLIPPMVKLANLTPEQILTSPLKNNLEQSIDQTVDEDVVETLMEGLLAEKTKSVFVSSSTELESLQLRQVPNSLSTLMEAKVDTNKVQSFISDGLKLQGETATLKSQEEFLVTDDILLKGKQSLQSQNSTTQHLESMLSQIQPRIYSATTLSTPDIDNHNIANLSVDKLSRLKPVSSSILTDEHIASAQVLAAQTLSVLSPQARIVLENKLNTRINSIVSQNVPNTVTTSIADSAVIKINANAGLDINLTQPSDTLPLVPDSLDFMKDKTQNLPNAFNQQALLTTQLSSQATSLLQTTVVPANTYNDSLPGISNPVLNSVSNSFSNIISPVILQAEIAEAFGRPAWSRGMGKQVLSMVNQHIGSAEIRLNPAHLGPIEILIDVSEDQVSVSLSSRHAIVREAMEQTLPKLREMLDENGFNLADADISKHSFAEQRESNAENRENKSNTHNSDHEQLLSSERNEPIQQLLSESAGTVDYFV